MLSRFENSDLICNRSQIQNERNASIATNKMSDAPVNDRFQFNQFESISTLMVHGLNRTSVPFPEQGTRVTFGRLTRCQRGEASLCI